MAYKSFEELDVWKRACKLVVDVYVVLKDCREFGLRDQMNRAAVSIPSNIAEGAERDSKKEFMHFLNIAKIISANPYNPWTETIRGQHQSVDQKSADD